MNVDTQVLQSDVSVLVRGDGRRREAWEFAKYFLASVAALAIDLGLFSICMRLMGLSYAWAACVAFIAGAGFAYLLSVKWVFARRKLAGSPMRELVIFVAIGTMGLALTQVILVVGIGVLGMMPEAVKLAAAGFTFVFNFMLRKLMLFVGPIAERPSEHVIKRH